MRGLLFFLLIAFPLAAFSQIAPITGSLTGTVYDDFGSVIPDAIVKIRDTDKTDRMARTNGEGVFKIDLKGGNYLVEVQAVGFHIFRLEKFRVMTRGVQNLDLVLEVGNSGGYEIPISRKKKGTKFINQN